MTLPTPQHTQTTDGIGLTFEEVPPPRTGVNGGKVAEYVNILKAMLDHPRKSVRITAGRNVSQLPTAWRRSHREGHAYAEVPIDQFVFETRQNPADEDERILYGTYVPTVSTE